jgi:hypothetical protein
MPAHMHTPDARALHLGEFQPKSAMSRKWRVRTKPKRISGAPLNQGSQSDSLVEIPRAPPRCSESAKAKALHTIEPMLGDEHVIFSRNFAALKAAGYETRESSPCLEGLPFAAVAKRTARRTFAFGCTGERRRT